jgi:hypothetical protein
VLGWAASPECGGVRTTVFWRMAPGDVPLIQRHVRSNATNIVRNSDGLWKIFGYRTSNAVRQGRCNDRSPSKPRIISFRVGQYSVLIVPTHMAIRFVQDRVKVRHLARPPSVCTGPSHLCFFFFFRETPSSLGSSSWQLRANELAVCFADETRQEHTRLPSSLAPGRTWLAWLRSYRSLTIPLNA